MISLNKTFRQHLLSERKPVLLFIAVLGAALVTGTIAAGQPLFAAGLVLVILLALAAIIWSDFPTLTVIFMLYTNAAVIAVKFHDVPFIAGAALPVLLIIPLTHHLILRRQRLIFTPALPLLFIFLAIQILGALFSEKSISLAIPALVAFVVEGIGLYFLITNVVRTPKMLRRAIWILLFAGALLGGLSFHQQITGTFDNNYGGFAQTGGRGFQTGIETLQGEVRQTRLSGPIGEKNRYAQIMLMLLPLGLFRFWSERSNWLRILAAIFTGLILIGGSLAFSRGAAVGFALMLGIMVSMRYLKFYHFIIIVLAIVPVMQLFPQYGTRLATLQVLTELASTGDTAGLAEVDGAIQGRTTEILAATLVFADHPLIGVGPGMFKYYAQDYAKLVGIRVLKENREAHILYLGIAADNGALGLICFLAIVAVTLRGLAHRRKQWIQSRPEYANMAMGFFLSIIGYLTTGLFLHMSFMRYFWLMLALADAASYVTNPDVLSEKETTGKISDKVQVNFIVR